MPKTLKDSQSSNPQRLAIAAEIFNGFMSRGMSQDQAVKAAFAAADQLIALESGAPAPGGDESQPSQPQAPALSPEVQAALQDLQSKISSLVDQTKPTGDVTPAVRTDVGDITSPQSEYASVSDASQTDALKAHRQSLKYAGKSMQRK